MLQIVLFDQIHSITDNQQCLPVSVALLGKLYISKYYANLIRSIWRFNAIKTEIRELNRIDEINADDISSRMNKEKLVRMEIRWVMVSYLGNAAIYRWKISTILDMVKSSMLLNE